MTTNYRGVTYVATNRLNPWKAQIRLLGKTYALGHFATDEEAARAYDNMAFYANARGLPVRELQLNFPDDYAHESYPSQSDTTRRVLLDLATRAVHQKNGEPNRTELIAYLRSEVREAQARLDVAEALLRRYNQTA